MKNITIEVPRIPAQVWFWLRQALAVVGIALLIAGLIWLIGSIHMNAGSWLGVFGLLISMVMLIDSRLP
jgi:hypothetical protein